ncbi:hypothetical protein [Pontibacter chitinilyticus]|uniref:hypothetical protein n=1 Tax=Pontibacter chitinilyticus TaxID=2674989 RepID=UPI003218FFF6
MFLTYHTCKRNVYLLLLSLCACQIPAEEAVMPQPAKNTIMYLIPKGEHYATSHPFKATTTTKLSFEVTFDSTAIYTSVAPENQGDINKLYGVSDCGVSHQTNSARFGWRWYNNQLEIHAYTYLNQVRQSKYIGTVELGQKNTCTLELCDGTYTFRLNGQQVELPRACTGAGAGYQLYPYFGGDEVAPHAITIQLKELH